MIYDKKYIQIVTISLIIVFLFLSQSVSAANPGWDDVPKELKKESGLTRKDQWLFITGAASVHPVESDIAQAHETAREASLLNALKLLHVEATCKKFLNELSQKDIDTAYEVFAAALPPLHIQGIVVIRQWESGNNHYSVISTPINSLKNISCPFSSFSDAAKAYVQQENYTLKNLDFLLGHVPRYTAIERIIQKKISSVFQAEKQLGLGLIFLPVNLATLTSPLSMQLSLAKAEIEVQKARAFVQKKEWEQALTHIDNALMKAPSYSPAYILIGYYLLDVEQMPALALFAAKKSLQSGTHFNEGLKLMVDCLEASNSPEAQVYQYVLQHSEKFKNAHYPAEGFDKFINRVEQDIPLLVFCSVGNAISGQPKRPGSNYDHALEQFNASNSDEDIKNTLLLLFDACEKTPLVPETYNLIGACYRNLGKPINALPFLWAALGLRPDYDLTITNLGLCCRQLKLMQSAAYYFAHPAVKNSRNQWVKESYEQFRSGNDKH